MQVPFQKSKSTIIQHLFDIVTKSLHKIVNPLPLNAVEEESVMHTFMTKTTLPGDEGNLTEHIHNAIADKEQSYLAHRASLKAEG